MGDVSFWEDNYEGSSISHTLAHNRGGCADRHVVGLAEGSIQKIMKSELKYKI